MSDKRPAHLGPAGRKLWDSIAAVYELDEHEQGLLLGACRTRDLLDTLEERVREDGPVISTPQGERAHPAAVEARQQWIVYARLIAALRLPSEDSEQRPPRRAGAVGVRRPQPAADVKALTDRLRATS